MVGILDTEYITKRYMINDKKLIDKANMCKRKKAHQPTSTAGNTHATHYSSYKFIIVIMNSMYMRSSVVCVFLSYLLRLKGPKHVPKVSPTPAKPLNVS